MKKSLIFIAFILFSCSQEKNDLETPIVKVPNVMTIDIDQHNNSKVSKSIIEVKLKGENLLSEYAIFGGHFSDNGEGYDKISGDGIYTSLNPGKIISTSSKASKGGEVSCDFRVVRCYDDDCPFWGGCCITGSVCYCIEFYNCKLIIKW